MSVDASEVLRAAKAAQSCGRLDEAGHLCREALNIEPDCVEAILTLAGLLQNTGDYRGAIDVAERAVQLRPNLFNGHSILGYCFLETGQAQEAVDSLARAIALAPDVAILHHLSARALLRLDRAEDAAAAFRRSIRLAPHMVDSHLALGQLELNLGNRSEAFACFRRVYKLEPNSARGLSQLAKVLVEDGRPQEAEDALRKAVILDPAAQAAHTMLGEVLLQLGRFDEASAVLESAISAKPKIARPYLQLVQCRKQSGADLPLIEGMLSMLAEPDRSMDDLRCLNYAVGKAFDDLGEFSRAIKHFDEANRIMHRLARPPFNRALHASQVQFAINNFTSEVLAQSIGSESDQPVFVVGMIRSGTTLVEQILASHPDVGAAGEQKFWLEHSRGLVDSDPSRMDHAALREAADQYLAHLTRIQPGKCRIVDKMPTNFMVLGLIHLAFPNARIIHCRRNALDTCMSIYLTPFSDPVNYAHNRNNIVRWYEDYLRLTEHWRSVLPGDRFMDIDYEHLVADPERVAREMTEFIGIEWDSACLRPERNGRAVRTPSMWQVRQPVYRSSVERWRNYEPWLGEFRQFLTPDPPSATATMKLDAKHE